MSKSNLSKYNYVRSNTQYINNKYLQDYETLQDRTEKQTGARAAIIGRSDWNIFSRNTRSREWPRNSQSYGNQAEKIIDKYSNRSRTLSPIPKSSGSYLRHRSASSTFSTSRYNIFNRAREKETEKENYKTQTNINKNNKNKIMTTAIKEIAIYEDIKNHKPGTVQWLASKSKIA